MKIVLYIFLGLCAFFIGLPIVLHIIRVILQALLHYLERKEFEAKYREPLKHLEQCLDCKYNGWLYDKNRPTGDDARYHNGEPYGVCCHYGARFPLDSTFKADPGEKCEHYERKESEE